MRVTNQLFGVGMGSNVTLSCNVQAHPKAIAYWMKNENGMIVERYV